MIHKKLLEKIKELACRRDWGKREDAAN